MILEDTLRRLRLAEKGELALDRRTAKDAADAIELLLGMTRAFEEKEEAAGK